MSGDKKDLQAILHRPHGKDYCVNFQAEHGTLRGIQNTWDKVDDGSCAWENQQHGRGHHLKVCLKNARDGMQFRMRLLQEDGNPAPPFTITKSGSQKSTMLVGIDARDWRQGLSWKHVDQEGPRRWHPASSFTIKIASSIEESACEVATEDCFILKEPCGESIFIPIRIEVLSAVKGAGNFSRYSVQLEEITSDWQWNSPSILVEAKWLPAAPVRVQNKSRTDEKKDEKQTGCGDHDSEHFYDACNTVTQHLELFCNPGMSMAVAPSVDLAVQKLLCTLAKYQLTRTAGLLPHGMSSCGAKRPLQISTEEFPNKKLEREVLSSPPKGPRAAPFIPTQLMQAISLPPPVSDHPFSKFEILAQAASFKMD